MNGKKKHEESFGKNSTKKITVFGNYLTNLNRSMKKLQIRERNPKYQRLGWETMKEEEIRLNDGD